MRDPKWRKRGKIGSPIKTILSSMTGLVLFQSSVQSPEFTAMLKVYSTDNDQKPALNKNDADENQRN